MKILASLNETILVCANSLHVMPYKSGERNQIRSQNFGFLKRNERDMIQPRNKLQAELVFGFSLSVKMRIALRQQPPCKVQINANKIITFARSMVKETRSI